MFSVVLPTKDRPDRLKKLSDVLDSLAAQRRPPEHEIIVVDENPRSGVEELAGSLDAGCDVRYVPLEGAGVVSATNEAVRRARGDVILFLGDDTTADPGMMREHELARGRGDSAAVLGWTKWHPRVRQTPLTDFARSMGPQLDPRYLPEDKANLPFYFFMTANLSVPRKALFDAGLFDEDFTYPAYEDCEMGYRLTRAGVRITFNERAVAYHDHEVTVEGLCDRQRKIGHGMVVFTRKHPMEEAIASKTRDCGRYPFGGRTAGLLRALAGRLEGWAPAPLLKANYMLLYETCLAVGVREELSGVRYEPAEGGY
jgi:GT2 family glycosyltransferase